MTYDRKKVIDEMIRDFGVDAAEEIIAYQRSVMRYVGGGSFFATDYRNAEATYWRAIPTWMKHDAESSPVKSVLDIGCGYGTLLNLAGTIFGAEARLVGVDSRRYIPREVSKYYFLGYKVADVQLIDGLDALYEGFDVVIMTEVLEHFNLHPVPTLLKVASWMKPGGVLYLSTPDQASWGNQEKYVSGYGSLPTEPPEGYQPVDDHIWHYSRKEVEDILKESSFLITNLVVTKGCWRDHFNVRAVRAA